MNDENQPLIFSNKPNLFIYIIQNPKIAPTTFTEDTKLKKIKLKLHESKMLGMLRIEIDAPLHQEAAS